MKTSVTPKPIKKRCFGPAVLRENWTSNTIFIKDRDESENSVPALETREEPNPKEPGKSLPQINRARSETQEVRLGKGRSGQNTEAAREGIYGRRVQSEQPPLTSSSLPSRVARARPSAALEWPEQTP